MHQRNAARVLPVPVGARISVDSPRAMAGHPWTCGLVGAGKTASNHSRTAGWNKDGSSVPPAAEWVGLGWGIANLTV